MLPSVSMTTSGSWPRRADGAMNPPSVVTSTRSEAAAGVGLGCALGLDDGVTLGSRVGASVGVAFGGGVPLPIGVTVALLVDSGLGTVVGLPQAISTSTGNRNAASRSFMADPLCHVDRGSPRLCDDAEDRLHVACVRVSFSKSSGRRRVALRGAGLLIVDHRLVAHVADAPRQQ